MSWASSDLQVVKTDACRRCRNAKETARRCKGLVTERFGPPRCKPPSENASRPCGTPNALYEWQRDCSIPSVSGEKLNRNPDDHCHDSSALCIRNRFGQWMDIQVETSMEPGARTWERQSAGNPSRGVGKWHKLLSTASKRLQKRHP